MIMNYEQILSETIAKALKWYCLDCECNDNCKLDGKCFFYCQFKRYLEGDDKALPPKIQNSIDPDGSTSESYRYRHFISNVKGAYMQKACEWIARNIDDYLVGDVIASENLLKDFRKAMGE